MKISFISVWGYFVEIILSFLLFALLFILFEVNIVFDFFEKTSQAWIWFLVAVITIFVAFLIHFLALANSEFGKWLNWKSKYSNYLSAIITTISIFILTGLSLGIYSSIKTKIIGYIFIWLIIMCGINLITSITNIMGFMRLQTKFNYEYRKNEKSR